MVRNTELALNSQNSSKPPSQDPNRKRGSTRREKSGKKPGGQKGHKGTTLQLAPEPDEIISIEIDRGTIPSGDYEQCKPERRQVFEIVIEKHLD